MLPPQNTTPDLRVYATVLCTDHSIQYTATGIICTLATFMTILTLYLLWKKSPSETFGIKFWGFVYQLSMYSAEMQLGVFGGMVTLYPFPATYCQGVLSGYFVAFTLFVSIVQFSRCTFQNTWVLTFCTFGYSCFMMQILRLRVMARHGKLFDCKKPTYFIICALLSIIVYIPIPSMMFLTYSTPEEMREFVMRKYPNNLMALETPGIYIFTDSEFSDLVHYVMAVNVLVVFLIMTFIYVSIYWETRGNGTSQSLQNMKDKLKKLRTFLVRATLMSGSVLVSSYLIFKSLFNDPTYDSRIENAISYSCLCGISIPSQVLMILRKKEYMDFVLRRKRQVRSNPLTSERLQSTVQNNV